MKTGAFCALLRHGALVRRRQGLTGLWACAHYFAMARECAQKGHLFPRSLCPIKEYTVKILERNLSPLVALLLIVR